MSAVGAAIGLAAGALMSLVGSTSVAAARTAAKTDGKTPLGPTLVGGALTAGGVGLSAYSGFVMAKAKKANPSTPRAATGELEDAYRDFHWGTPPTGPTVEELSDTTDGVYSLGQLVAVEYSANKGGKRRTYRHTFSRPRPHLTGTIDGRLGPIVGGRARVESSGIID